METRQRVTAATPADARRAPAVRSTGNLAPAARRPPPAARRPPLGPGGSDVERFARRAPSILLTGGAHPRPETRTLGRHAAFVSADYPGRRTA